MSDDDRPLDTQTAAPPAVPPRRPIGAAAMEDGDERRARRQEQLRQLDECRRLLDEILAANQIAGGRLEEWQARLEAQFKLTGPPDA
jgi:hypothetical protein